MPIQKLPGSAIAPGTITVVQLESTVVTTVQTGGGPKITNVQVTSNSYVVLDDTAVDIAGGYIKITGTGFAAGCQVLINNTPATSTTFIGPTEVRAQLPASSAGTYMLYLINADGGVAIRVNGVTFSATPSWVTASDLTSYALGDAISIQLAATGASTFALAAGSTLPTGLTLSAGGLLSGSVTGLENDTSYSFTITATDAENQDSPRTFTITITVQLQVSRSLRFNSADSAYLSRTPTATGNRKTWTWSAWIKRSELVQTNDWNLFVCRPSAGTYTLFTIRHSSTVTPNSLLFEDNNGMNLITSSVYRDVSAWYHIVLSVDTTQATAANRVKIYVNGSLITSFSSSTYPAQNIDLQINSTNAHGIGGYSFNTAEVFDGYIAEVYFIDGQALTPSAFAETNSGTGQYIPKKYTGTYGTNGFYLPFTDNSSVLNLGRNYQPLTADPFWDRTVLLLNGTGTNNANNNTFTDSSTNAFAITSNGNVSQGRFSPFTQGGWSNYLNSTSGNYISVSASNAFDVGTNDFTLELWFYINPGATSYNGWGRAHILGGAEATGSSRIAIVVNGSSLGSSGLTWNVGSTSGSYATAVSQGQWHHAALIRSGTAITLYLNGSAVSTGTSSASIANNIQHIGAFRATDDQFSDYFYGYISNVRFIKNQAVYSGSTVGTTYFTPSTSPLTTTSIGSTGAGVAASITGTVSLLTCQSNRFLDQTGKTITLTGSPSVVAFSPFTPTTAYSAATHGGSAYFDGSGDYLTVADNTALEVPTQDFTIEAWVYLTSLPSSGAGYTVIQKGRTGTSDFEYSFEIENNAGNMRLLCRTSSNGTSLTTANGNTISLAANTWYHIAVTRTTTTASFWFEGVAAGSGTVNSTTYTGAATVGLFANNAGSSPLVGYASNFRLVKGVAVYTGAFTPPTAPLTAITNTSLLLNFTNAGIQDATGDNNIETVGDAKISTAQSKWAGSSMAFDGTGDYLSVPYSPNLNMGTGNFTCEFWVYVPSNPSVSYPSIIGPQDTAPYGIGIRYGNTGYANKFTVHLYAVSSWVGDPILASSSTYSLSQWHHVALTRSGTTLTLWVNGVSAASTTSSNQIDFASNNKAVWIGASFDGANSYFNGYIQDLRITRAARYTGNFTPPTAQFAYNQGDINYNQWVPTNFSVTAGAGNDSLLDVPTNWGVDTGLGGEVRGNYCVGNWANSNDPSGYLTDGGLRWAVDNTRVITGTFGMSEGKWYCEATPFAIITTLEIGIIATSIPWPSTNFNSPGSYANGYTYLSGGNKYNNNSSTAYGASYTTNDVIGIAFDADARTITFYKNGVSQGTAFSSITTGSYVICARATGVGSSGFVMNFGQRPFAYAAPSGFKSLNTHNLPALAVTKSNTAFDTVLYTGNGSTQTIGGLNFAPDLVWIKDRSSSVVGHRLYDTIRGATKEIYTHSTNAETTDAAGLTAFTANGFTTGNSAGTNTNGDNLVAWAWDAGTTTVVNTAGTIQSNVRVNSTSGFSIVSWTGTGAVGTIGHNLGVAPSMIIVKARSTIDAWYVYHVSRGPTIRIQLNETSAETSGTTVWNSTSPTSTVFSIGNGNPNSSAVTYVAYCFAAVPGFSAFGTYTGNGSTDGPFVYLGFRPKFLLTKRANSTSNWLISDAVRNSENPVTRELYPNAPDSEPSPNSAYAFDFLSNGVKLRRATDSSLNISGGTYIYAAFAESPFKYARAR